MVTARMRNRIPLNTLAIPFGLSGLAGVWTAASQALRWPIGISLALWAVAALSWVLLIVAHTVRGARSEESLASQLRHPAQGPIAALIPVVGMLLGAAVHSVAPLAGTIMVILSIAGAALFAGWLLGFWATGPLTPDSLHGGFFIPTVGGALVASAAAATIGLIPLAIGAFAIGIFFWIVVFALLLARLATRPPLPGALTPTLAIAVAPPAVAGSAWFAINGGEPGYLEYAFAGVAVIMVLMQVALIPRYRALRFTLGFWSFTFPFAAVAGYAIEWLFLLQPPLWQVLVIAITAAITVLVVTIGLKSIALGLHAPRRAEAQLLSADNSIDGTR